MKPGLDRIVIVAKILGVDRFTVPVITVAGTNGKGSTIAIMNAILQAQNVIVGATTSPHLHKFNERISINNENINDAECCELFSIIDKARSNIKITYFEFSILAALLAFKRSKVDIILLEVGLGGRLDATNCVKNDIAIITSIDLDHTNWLGDTREKIAFEKAGIFKENAIAVCGEIHAPEIISQIATDKNTKLLAINKDFYYKINNDNTWCLEPGYFKSSFPMPTLNLQNAATSIIALLQLRKFGITISYESVMIGLKDVHLPGRFQVVHYNNVEIIYDVAHNPASAKLLATNLSNRRFYGSTFAVFGVLNTKDYKLMIAPLIKIVSKDNWYCASLAVNNTVPGKVLVTNLNKQYGLNAICYDNIIKAFLAAKSKVTTGDRIVIFGSFYAVAEVQSLIYNSSI